MCFYNGCFFFTVFHLLEYNNSKHVPMCCVFLFLSPSVPHWIYYNLFLALKSIWIFDLYYLLSLLKVVIKEQNWITMLFFFHTGLTVFFCVYTGSKILMKLINYLNLRQRMVLNPSPSGWIKSSYQSKPYQINSQQIRSND